MVVYVVVSEKEMMQEIKENIFSFFPLLNSESKRVFELYVPDVYYLRIELLDDISFEQFSNSVSGLYGVRRIVQGISASSR